MSDKKSTLEKLQESLYQKGRQTNKKQPWSRFTKKRYGVAEDWEHEHGVEVPDEPTTLPKRRMNTPMKLFIFSVAFFVIALTIAAFVISRGTNSVSSENIDIAVTGSVTVAGGEELSLQIDVTNHNNATLEGVDLVIELPEGTRDPANTSEPLQRITAELGDILPGDTASQTVSAVLFGAEDSEKPIVIGIEYRIAGSNAIFFKESEFVAQIGTAPISLIVDMPTEVNAGREMELTLEVVSNSQEIIRNFAVMAEYPFGFFFAEADPAPDVGDTLWRFGDLEPQGRRTIHLTGTIEGQDEEERTFRFSGGILEDADDREIATTLLETQRSLAIKRPFVEVGLTLNGRSDDTVIVVPTQRITGVIVWRNNLPVPVDDAVIEAVLTGDRVDERSVRVINGFYRSIDNTVVWDKERTPQLDQLEPGANGQLTFEFDMLDFEPGAGTGDSSIVVSVGISGRRVGDSPDTTGEVSSATVKNIRVASDARIDARAVYSTGPFENEGPIPPEAEVETTYTVIWSLTNTTNDLTGVSITASLPDYVEWVGTVDPSNETVTFNQVTRQVLWDTGLVLAGAGYSRPPKEVAFQIRLLPSLSQVGLSPVLLGQTTMEAFDAFVSTSLRTTDGEVTTAITSDPIYDINAGRVTE